MALAYAHGAIQWLAADAATTTYTVSGLSFQPKAIKFYCTGIYSATDATSTTANYLVSIGFAVSATERRSVSAFSADNSGLANTSTARADNAVAVTSDGTTTISGLLDISSFETDGFVLIVDDATPQDLTIFWEAWGGTDITVAKVGDFNSPVSTGNQDVTATGLVAAEASQVVMLAGTKGGTINTASTGAALIFAGFTSGAASAKNVVVFGKSADTLTTTNTTGYCQTGECIAMAPSDNSSVLNCRAILSSFGTDKFTVNWLETSTDATTCIFLAIRGGNWTAGAYTIDGSTLNATSTVSGLSYAPIGLSVIGRLSAQSTNDTLNDNNRIMIGCGSSTTSRRAISALDADNAATSGIYTSIQYDAALCFLGVSASDYDINAMNSDGFQIIVDTAGGVASEWQGYLAFGDGADAGAMTGSTTTTFSGAGVITGDAPILGTSTIAFSSTAPLAGSGALAGLSTILISLPATSLTDSPETLLIRKDELGIKKYVGWYQCDLYWAAMDSQEISGTTYQVGAYWSDTNYLVIGKRTLTGGAASPWTYYHYNGVANSPSIAPTANDAHQFISIALDKNGYVHICGGTHDAPIRYRKSDAAISTWTGGMTAEISMMGTHESVFTYPIFFKDPLSELYIIFRDGGSFIGNWYFYKYNVSTPAWEYAAGMGTEGMLSNGVGSSVGSYQFTPTFTRNFDGAGAGFMHFAWCWNDSPNGQFDIIHIRWDGTTVTQWDGTAQTMPVTVANGRVVVNIADGDVIGQSNACVDANDYYHLVVQIKDISGIWQLNDVYCNNSTWITKQLTSNPVDIMTPDASDPYGWIAYASAPPINFCNFDTNTMYVLKGRRTGVTGTGIGVFTSNPGDFTTWTESTFDVNEIGYVSLTYDKPRWDKTRELYLWVSNGRSTTGPNPADEYPRIISHTLIENGAMAGSSTVTISPLALISIPGPLAGSSTLTFSGSATLSSEGVLAGTGTVTFTPAGTLTVSALTLSLTGDQAIRLEAVMRRHGLIDPLVITPDSIGDGTLVMTRAWDGTTETDTVTGLPVGNLVTAALVDKLARNFGLIDPIEVTANGRTDGTLTQTFVQVGDDITVTTL